MTEINFIELEQNFWTTFQAKSQHELLTLATSIGKIIPSRKNVSNPIDILTIKKKGTANPKSLSALYGDKIFPFHTDGAYIAEPPNYIILRNPKKISNCPTLICKPIFTLLDRKALAKNVWLVNGGRGKFYTTIIEENGNDYRIRFDLACMRPALAAFNSSAVIMDSVILSSSCQEIHLDTNQCLILDNWKLLHSRADATKSIDRALERIWIKK